MTTTRNERRDTRHRLTAWAAAATLALGLGSAVADDPPGFEVGQDAYAMCAACHQQDGSGVPGAFPPLAGHAVDLFLADDGAFLIRTILFGLQGPIEVDGMTYDGVMPPHAQLSDEQVAGLIAFLTHAWNDDGERMVDTELPDADTVAEIRSEGLSPSDVHALRSELDLE